ncbi:MAG: transcriptional regulator [Sphaerochaeta sp.]|jgi:DNA-binding MarR family transcriptional regulator|nr:transcriptional regulator [Sphaerochaeta sp.]MDX9914858.1 transcriptional regulator [Sphaerochaeta sp.]
MAHQDDEESSIFDHRRLDTVLHSRLRLAIVAALAGCQSMDFTSLRDVVGATDGNMTTHLTKLEEAEYISIHKEFVERKPRTSIRLTEKGKEALAAYLATLDGFLRTTR